MATSLTSFKLGPLLKGIVNSSTDLEKVRDTLYFWLIFLCSLSQKKQIFRLAYLDKDEILQNVEDDSCTENISFCVVTPIIQNFRSDIPWATTSHI